MNKWVNILFAFTLLLQIQQASAQTRAIDMVLSQIGAAKTDEAKLSAIFKLTEQNINPDTLYPYIVMAEALALKTDKQVYRDSTTLIKASYYIRRNYIDSSLLLIDKLISTYENDKSKRKFYLDLLFFKAKIYDRGNLYTRALKQLFKVLETAEEQRDTLIQIQAKTGIGWVQMEMEQYHEALNWLLKALNTSTNRSYYKNYGALYSNLATTYNALGKTDSAFFYINTAIKDAREFESLVFLATALNMKAKILINSKQPQLAEAPLYEAVEIRKKINDPFYTVYDMSSLASFYASNNQPDKGIALCMEGIRIAKQSGLSSQLLMIYNSLAENYKASGDMMAYGSTLESIIALKDSFNNLNSTRLLAEMQAGSEKLKNEKTIAEQNLDIARKNYWLYGSAVFILMSGVIALLLFMSYRRRQNLKMQMALDEEKRIAAQAILQAEEQERKRIAADLHDNIGAYASAIRADIDKLTDGGTDRFQGSLQNLQQHSQEIISSLRDTIWVLNKENITITGISDRIKNYISKLQPSYDHIQIHFDENIANDVRVSSQKALNIFRIIQEAIHNALKHSGASHINIGISSKEQILFSISDNGKGLEETGTEEGNGLINMYARARETGMQLSISSDTDKGTVLVLTSGTTN